MSSGKAMGVLKKKKITVNFQTHDGHVQIADTVRGILGSFHLRPLEAVSILERRTFDLRISRQSFTRILEKWKE
jgi:hypothetical protein